MKLASLLHSDCVLTGHPASTVDEAIQSIFKQLYREFKFELDREKVLAEVAHRETLGGTVLPCGIAIPHARIDGLEDLVAGVLIPKTPFTADGIQVKMVFLLLSSQKESAVYLNTLAAIARVGKDPALLEKLVKIHSGQQFLEILNAADISIQKEITVADIMRTGVLTLSPDDNLRTVGDKLKITGYTMLPVLDGSGKLVGEVTSHDFIARALPDYTSRMENLSFLSNLEPFDEFLRHEERITVREILTKPDTTLKTSSSVVEAAHELVKHKKHCLCVVDDGIFKGVVGHSDLISKVMRG